MTHEEHSGHRHFLRGAGIRGLPMIAALSLIKNKSAHGGEIVQSLKETFAIEEPSAVIYMMLRRLEREGLVVSSWDTPESGPATRKYTITEEGLEYVTRSMERLQEMSKTIKLLIDERK